MYDISQKIDKFNLEIFIKIKEITDKLGIDYFIVGATVRDIILNYVYNIIIYRKTNDVDFGVRVRNWDEYKLLLTEVEKVGFKKSESIMHRYTYKSMIIDFIPFGEISINDENIIWPDKYQKEMNVIGFDEAFINSDEILIQNNPEIIVRMASVEFLVILKIISWNERSIDLRLSDAKDLYLIITSYLKAGNEARLFDHEDIVDLAIDYELSGAMLLGRDISKAVSKGTLERILEILSDDKLAALANEMTTYEVARFENHDQRVEWCLELLKSLKLGLTKKVA